MVAGRLTPIGPMFSNWARGAWVEGGEAGGRARLAGLSGQSASEYWGDLGATRACVRGQWLR